MGLRYGIGPEVLQDISFDLKPGSFHFLTGPSGAGKSSLLKIMYLALRPSRGLVYIFGHSHQVCISIKHKIVGNVLNKTTSSVKAGIDISKNGE